MSWRWYSVIVLLPMTLMTIISTVLPLQWISMVPDPMATHFDSAGNADGYSSPTSSIALITGINGVVVIAIAIALQIRYLTGTNGRILSGSANATVVLTSLIQLHLFKIQTTVSEAVDTILPLSTLGVAFGISTAVGIGIGWVPPPPCPGEKGRSHS